MLTLNTLQMECSSFTNQTILRRKRETENFLF